MTNSFAEALARRAKASETKPEPRIVEQDFSLPDDPAANDGDLTVDDIQLGDFDLRESVAPGVEQVATTDKAVVPFNMSSLRITADEVVVGDDKPIVRDGFTIHTLPRRTIIDMVSHSKLDENYVFYTRAHSGEDYVQAMRQLLSRTRKKAKQDKLVLKQDFKLYTIEVVTIDNKYDRVTLLRSMSINHRFNSHFDEIMAALNGDEA